MVKVIDKQPRGVLIEGRSSGMAFGMAKRSGENEFTVVSAVSPCKDYLNDVVWAETNNKPFGAFGLYYKPIGIYEGDKAYMVIKMMTTKGSTTKGQPTEAMNKQLNDTITSSLKIVNFAEENFNLPIKSTADKIEGEEAYLITFPKQWCDHTAGISLYTLLLRLGLYWNGEGDVMTFLRKENLSPIDAGLWKPVLELFEWLITNKTLPNKLPNDQHPTTTGIHSSGILWYNSHYFKTKPQSLFKAPTL